jgi:hypothetical protein
MPENLTSVTALAGAIGALVAAIVVSLSNLFVTLINKRAEERKHYRELIINAAIENYKEEKSMAKAILERRPEIDQVFYPMDDFIINMAVLADFVIDKKIKPDELKEALIEMDKIRDMVRAHRNQSLPERLRKHDI